MNIKTGFCISTHGWLKRFNSEIRNKNEIYRRASPWMTGFDTISVAFLNKNSKHLQKLNKFILKMYTYGFMNYWARGMTIKKFSKRLREIKRITHVDFQAKLKDFRSNFFNHVNLMLLSVLVFFLELLWSKIKRGSKRRSEAPHH